MTDLEITRLCAEAMGIDWVEAVQHIWDMSDDRREDPYNPLRDDAQCMALVKKFRLHISIWDKLNGRDAGWWRVEPESSLVTCRHADLNRAVCECVAKLQATK